MGISDDLRAGLQDNGLPFHLELGDRLGDWKVEEYLGGGGMGSVHCVRNIYAGQRAAAKVLQRLSDEDLGRFLEEARSMARVEHDNVARLFGCGKLDGREFGAPDVSIPYYIMEYLDGEDLEKRLRRVRRLDFVVARPLLIQIARGLAAIHRQGLVHRDVKPGNIVIVARDGGELAKVVDLGLAKSTRDSQKVDLTRTGMVVGSLSYIAPEQLQGHELSERTDVYSLGVVIYRVITGKLPFSGDTPAVVIAGHLQGVPEAPSRAAPGAGIPRDLDRLVLRCLEKRPEHRYASMAALIDALDGTATKAAGSGWKRLLAGLVGVSATILVVFLRDLSWVPATKSSEPVALSFDVRPSPGSDVNTRVQVAPNTGAVAAAPTSETSAHIAEPLPNGGEPVTPIGETSPPSTRADPVPAAPKHGKRPGTSRPNTTKAVPLSEKVEKVETKPPAPTGAPVCAPELVLASVASAVQQCRGGLGGMGSRRIEVDVLIDAEEARSIVLREPKPSPKDLQACVEKAIKAAKFEGCAVFKRQSYKF